MAQAVQGGVAGVGPQLVVVLLALLPCGPNAARAPLVRGLRRARVRGERAKQAARAAREWSRAFGDSDENPDPAPLVRHLLRACR